LRALAWRILTAIVFYAALAPTWAVSPQDFAYGMRIESYEGAAAYQADLPLEVYRGAVRSDLGDLRVFNAAGSVVPYELRRPLAATGSPGPSRRLSVFPLRGDPIKALDAMRVTIESGGESVNLQTSVSKGPPATVSVYIVDARSMTSPTSALQLEWPDDAPDFAGRLNIDASEDLAAWRYVSHAVPIANLRSGKDRLIERRAEFVSTKPKFWRLTWSGGDAPFVLTGVIAEPARNFIEPNRVVTMKEGMPVPDRPNEFAYDLGARLPVDRINVELPERNSVASITVLSRTHPQEIWRSVRRHGFYRLDSPDGELRNGNVATGIDSDRYWLLRFDKPEDVGQGVPRLSVSWVPHELVFVARGEGPFTLAYGSSTAKPAETPIVEVLRAVTVAEARLSSPFELGGVSRLQPPAEPFPWKNILLWTVLTLGVGLLGWMAYRLSRQL
jgi:hypothetical protein